MANNSMKKLVFFINSLGMGGAEKVLLAYVKSLVTEYGYQVTVVTNENSENCYLCDEVKKYADYQFLTDDNTDASVGFLAKFKKSIQRKYRISKIIKKNDILIDFLDADFSKYLCKYKNEKITWLHLSYNRLKIDKRDVSKKISNYNKVISICKDICTEINDENPEWNNRVELIYNPFDFYSLDIKSNENLDENTEYEKILFSSSYYLTVSRLNEQSKTKDITTLLHAYAYAKDHGLKEKLVIIGDGPDRHKLELLSKKLQLENDVYFLGEKKNPYIWMKKARTFILSSRAEGFPTVLIEAMYFNGSLISTDCPTGPREILKNGEIGTLCELGSPTSLGNAMLNPPIKNDPIEANVYRKESSMMKLCKIIESLS